MIMGTKCRRGRGAAEEKQLGRLGGGGCKPQGVQRRSPWKIFGFGALKTLGNHISLCKMAMFNNHIWCRENR